MTKFLESPISPICPCSPFCGDSRGDTLRIGNRYTHKAASEAKDGDFQMGQILNDKTVLVKSAYLTSILSGNLVWFSGNMVCKSGIPVWYSGYMVYYRHEITLDKGAGF